MFRIAALVQKGAFSMIRFFILILFFGMILGCIDSNANRQQSWLRELSDVEKIALSQSEAAFPVNTVADFSNGTRKVERVSFEFFIPEGRSVIIRYAPDDFTESVEVIVSEIGLEEINSYSEQTRKLLSRNYQSALLSPQSAYEAASAYLVKESIDPDKYIDVSAQLYFVPSTWLNTSSSSPMWIVSFVDKTSEARFWVDATKGNILRADI